MATQRTPPPQSPVPVPMQPSSSFPNLATAAHEYYGSDSQIDLSLNKFDKLEGSRNVAMRSKRKFNEVAEFQASIDEIKSLFENFQQQQHLKLDQLNSAMCTIQERTEDIKKDLQFVSDKYDTFLERMSRLEQENSKNKKTIEYLESKIEVLERNSRASSIEINNIPRDRNENKESLRSIVKSIGNIIGQPINDLDVYDVYRIKTKIESKNPVIIQFTTTFMKNNLIKKCRTFNKDNYNNKLNTSHIQLAATSQSQPIYIDEFLTPAAKKLRYMVKNFKNEQGYHSYWNSYGKIYIKEKESSRPLRIDSEEDLLTLKKSK